MKNLMKKVRSHCANSIRRFAAIRSVVEQLEQRLLMSSGTNWGAQMQLTQTSSIYSAFPNLTGAGESIAIIDTGVDYNSPTLGGGFGPGHKVIAGWNFFNNNADPMDYYGHGTALATIAAGLPYTYNGQTFEGIAPKANIVALKVDDGTDILSPTRISQALQWVLDHQKQYNIVAINISEGFMEGAQKAQGASFANLLQQCHDRGILIAASSGNDGYTNSIEYPGFDPNVVAAGSVTLKNQVSAFTDSSPAMDILAPGDNVVIPWYNTNSKGIYITTSQGTSFSAPWICGTAALLHQLNPNLTPNQMLALMQQTGTKVTVPASGLTFSSLNVYKTLKAASTWTLPAKPTGLTATAVSDSSVSISFIDQANNETGYTLERSLMPNGPFALVATQAAVSGTGQKVTLTDTGLIAGTTYYYRVYATNALGNSTIAGPVSVVTQRKANSVPGAGPLTPTNLNANFIAGKQVVNLTFMDNASNESNFVVERSNYASSGFTQVGTVSAVPGTGQTATFIDTKVDYAKTYYYRVYAVNSTGASGYVGPIKVSTAIPNLSLGLTPPSNVTAVAAADGSSVAVSFVNQAKNQLGFALYRSTSSQIGFESGFVQVASVSGSVAVGQTVTMTDTTGVPGTLYYYIVRATAGTTASDPGNMVNATYPALPPPAAPTGLSATASADGTSVLLSFTNNAANATGFIIGRSTDPKGTFAQIGQISTGAGVGQTVTYTDSTNIVPGTTYYYFAYAINGTVASASTSVATATAAPALRIGSDVGSALPNSPYGLQLTANNGVVTVSFTDNSEIEDGFVLQRAGADGVFSTVATLSPSTGFGQVVTTTDTPPASGDWQYQVYATLGSVQSSATGPVAVTV